MVTNNKTNSGAHLPRPGPAVPQAHSGPAPRAPQSRAARSHPPHTTNRVELNRRRSIL